MPNQSKTFDTAETLGRVFLAISLFAFGLQQILYKGLIQGLELVPEWLPGHAAWSYFTGLVLIVSSIGILTGKGRHVSAACLVVIFFLCLVLLHGPRLLAIYHDGTERTRAFETIALFGGALFLLGIPFNSVAIQLGRFFFAAALLIFGIDHFLFARFIAALIPAWIPMHLFLAYFTGLVFVIAAVSIALLWLPNLFSAAVGFMLFLWVLVLHLPRVATHIRNGDEWNSFFVALATSGVAFLAIAALSPISTSSSVEPK